MRQHNVLFYFSKTFEANWDRMNVVSHELVPPISARYIRVHPESWFAYEAMRLEFYGCETCKKI